ncbi:protein POLYCHOME isoform X1 [Lycium ferocissimum]|uniref:protein POLYCHOME isoform X1 n=1 Tax=Lycium ferocissimum TaxID=112874 RepID=UPI002815D15F|nr:protein POLYCHOME isoform X1 [Lycium ferocissimum]
MPNTRDRLSRAEDLIGMYSRRRRRTVEGCGIAIFEDEQEERATMNFSAGDWNGARRRVGIGMPRNGNSARVIGRENISQGRGGHSVLPSWYPRTPLRDITSILRAIERRGARLGESEGQQLESPIPQDWTVFDPSDSTSGAQLEHDNSFMTPHPTLRSRHYPKFVGKVPKILLDITYQNDSGHSDGLTPERKLLHSIDKVEKAVMEELHKLMRTPIAKKQEREKRVGTLMSMR